MIRRNPLRPASFNLTRIQMPVGARTSITRRVNGVVLALGIPFGVYASQLSLVRITSDMPRRRELRMKPGPLSARSRARGAAGRAQAQENDAPGDQRRVEERDREEGQQAKTQSFDSTAASGRSARAVKRCSGRR